MPVDLTLDLLLSTASETRDSSVHREALRVLTLTDCWGKIDDALSRHVLETECFENQLLLGDLALNRIRMTLGLPITDDDYNETMTSTVRPVARQLISPALLDQAKQYYQTAHRLAGEQDKRLETRWYSDTVRQRQNQLTCLFPGH